MIKMNNNQGNFSQSLFRLMEKELSKYFGSEWFMCAQSAAPIMTFSDEKSLFCTKAVFNKGSLSYCEKSVLVNSVNF